MIPKNVERSAVVSCILGVGCPQVRDAGKVTEIVYGGTRSAANTDTGHRKGGGRWKLCKRKGGGNKGGNRVDREPRIEGKGRTSETSKSRNLGGGEVDGDRVAPIPVFRQELRKNQGRAPPRELLGGNAPKDFMEPFVSKEGNEGHHLGGKPTKGGKDSGEEIIRVAKECVTLFETINGPGGKTSRRPGGGETKGGGCQHLGIHQGGNWVGDGKAHKKKKKI